MKRFSCIALLLAGFALPVCAQHGGGFGSGHAGGFAGSHGGFSGSRSGFSGHAPSSRPAPFSHPAARPSPGSQGPANRPFGSHPNFGAAQAQTYRPRPQLRYGAQPLQSGPQGERRSPNRQPYRRPYAGGIVYESPYAYPAFYPVYPYDISGDGYFTDDSTPAPYYAQPYDGDQDGGYEPAYGYDQGASGPIAPGIPYSPYSGATSSGPAPVSPSPQDQAAQQSVILVFKDGRPNQRIHNFLINGNTLTVWDQHPHDIPVDQLNLAATEKINHDAGVDLFLPSASR